MFHNIKCTYKWFLFFLNGIYYDIIYYIYYSLMKDQV